MSSDRIIFKDSAGRALTFGDLKGADGTYKWEALGGKPMPDRARELHQQARAFGEKGDYAKATQSLEEAIRLAPDWPYPVYDLAYTHLLAGRPNEALSCYERVDKMAPEGFFTTKTALWTLDREKAGTFAQGTYLEYLSIEWAASEAEKTRIAKKLADKYSDFAPAWKELAQLSPEKNEKLQFTEKGLNSKPDVETYGILQINKALILSQDGKKEEAASILGELALDPKSTLASSHLAKAALATLIAAKK